jgi:hypothetical protein
VIAGRAARAKPIGVKPALTTRVLARRLRLARALLLRMGAMRGIITGRDVMQNVGIIYREFGARCLVRCLFVLAIGKQTTFLEVISQH